MADLKDKYSDTELDRSHKAFDEIVSQPDMRALDDQGNAIARELGDAENSPGESKKVDSTDTKDLRQAEENQSNPFGYERPSSERTKSSKAGNWSNKKKLAVGGGAAGGIGALMVSMLMLLPMKIPGIMQMIAGEAGQRVEQITEKRAKVIVGRYILNHAFKSNNIIITGNGAVASLMASMRTNNFEKKLEAKGLTIERTPDGVKLRMNNEVLGNGRTLKTEMDVLRAMEGNKLSNKMLGEIIKEEIPSWRWMKRAKFAKWLRIKYGIPRYGLLNSDKADQEARVNEIQENRMRAEYEALAADIGEATECVLTVDCEVDTQEDGRPEGVHESGDASAIADSVDGTIDETVEANSADAGNSAQKTLISQVMDKLGSKAIPIVGWIDLLATLDHIAWEASEKDYFGKLAASYRASQYARHYGTWEGYGSQIQLGAMDPAFIGVLAAQTEGVEEAQAFKYIEGEPDKGLPVEKIGANSESDYAKQLQELRKVLQPTSNIPGASKTIHEVLNLYYETIGGGGLLGWASDKIGGFVSKIVAGLTPESFEEWLGKTMQKVGGKLFEILGLDFDPGVRGAEWMNAAHGGATWSYNDFCKNEMGCRKLSPAQAAQQNSTIAQERSLYNSQKGIAYTLLSSESNSSVITNLAIHTPTDFSTFVARINKVVADTPATMLSMFMKKTSAAGYTDIHGVDAYGALQSELEKPVDPRAAAGEACDETFDGKSLDLCQTDTMTAQAMLCEYEPDSEDCSEETEASVGTGEGVEFTVASYNILHSISHTGKSKDIGGCNQNPVPGDPTCAKTRTAHQVKLITGENGNPAFDIFGTQETSPEQFDLLKSSLPSYSAFPNDTSRMSNNKDGAVAIFWNNQKFTKIEEGKAPGISNTSLNITNPWVGLQATSGQKVYVMSIHYAIGAFGGTPESIKKSSQLTMDWVKSKSTGDNIVIVVGDFNDRLTEKNSYCVYTEGSAMQHAVDMVAKASPDKGCGSNRFNGIDHIYATPKNGLEAYDWKHMAKSGDAAKASDHTPVYTTYKIPGAETAGSTIPFASYNVRTSGLNNAAFGDNNAVFDEGDRKRMEGIGKLISEKGLHIVAAQEVSGKVRGALLESLPETFKATNLVANSDVAVYWDSTIYDEVDTGTFPVRVKFDGTSRPQVWVKLKHKASGSELFVFNLHLASSDTREELRKEGASQTIEKINNVVGSSGTPFIVAGDMNGNDSDPARMGVYNIFKNSGLMNYTREATENRTGNHCDSHNDKAGTGNQDCRDPNSKGSHIDMVWVSKSPAISTTSYNLIADAVTSKLSDHNPLLTTLSIPGMALGGGDWVLPVEASGWQSDGQRWLEPHYGTGDAWTNSIRAAVDINIGSGNSDCGKPVYAMFGGTIVSNPPTYTMQVKSLLNGQPVTITYAHGNNMKKSGTVRAGQQIMTIGNQSSGKSTACHLHLEILYGAKPICPQNVLPLIAAKTPVDLAVIPEATTGCGG